LILNAINNCRRRCVRGASRREAACRQTSLIAGSPSSSIETEEVGFFPEDALPELSLGRVTAAQITQLFQHYRQADLRVSITE